MIILSTASYINSYHFIKLSVYQKNIVVLLLIVQMHDWDNLWFEPLRKYVCYQYCKTPVTLFNCTRIKYQKVLKTCWEMIVVEIKFIDMI